MHKQRDITNTMNMYLDINWPIQQHLTFYFMLIREITESQLLIIYLFIELVYRTVKIITF